MANKKDTTTDKSNADIARMLSQMQEERKTMAQLEATIKLELRLKSEKQEVKDLVHHILLWNRSRSARWEDHPNQWHQRLHINMQALYSWSSGKNAQWIVYSLW